MDPRRRRVSEIMQTEVATLASDEHLDLADDVMALGRVRHMPVLEGGRLVGLVSERDLLAASLTKMLAFEEGQRRAFMRSVRVDEAMTRDVAHIGPDATLAEAVELMLKRRIHSLPVVAKDDTLIGLVTDTDLLRAGFLGDEEADVVELAGEGVSEKADRFQKELDALRQVRDELRLQIHLGANEAKEVWERMEKKWAELEAKARFVRREAEEPLREVGEAARKLAEEIRHGYERIRRAL